MERYSRLIQLHRLLLDHRLPVPRRLIEAELDCSRATVNRLLEQLRVLTRDPIPYDAECNGYRYRDPQRQRDALPFLGLGPEELNALLLIDHQLQQLGEGFLGELLQPLGTRVHELLTARGQNAAELPRRIRILAAGSRAFGARLLPLCAKAVLQRRRIDLRYHARSDDRTEARQVSPQRLVHYRDNWYLDAWCHRREGLRSFAIERIERAQLGEEPALELADADLDQHYGQSYGIFAGPARHLAVLRFSPQRARWVAEEHWHPQQQGQFLDDGRYELRLPYGEPAELILDILRYGPDVEVLEPPELRSAVIERLRAALAGYGG